MSSAEQNLSLREVTICQIAFLESGQHVTPVNILFRSDRSYLKYFCLCGLPCHQDPKLMQSRHALG